MIIEVLTVSVSSGEMKRGGVYLLEFGELHNLLEGPHSRQEFLDEHSIEMRDYGVRTPIMLGDFSTRITDQEYRVQ